MFRESRITLSGYGNWVYEVRLDPDGMFRQTCCFESKMDAELWKSIQECALSHQAILEKLQERK